MNRKLRIVLFSATLVLSIAVVLSLLIKPKLNNIDTLTLSNAYGPPVGSSAPNFNLVRLNPSGGSTEVSLPKGQNVLLTFFASWCTDCKADLTLLTSNSAKLDFKIIGVDSGDTLSDGKALIKEYKIDFAVGFDPNETLVTGSYDTKGLPFSVLINSKGKVVASHLGALTKSLLISYSDKL
jgi:thiol-disulfide isomerase/thioredoxin